MSGRKCRLFRPPPTIKSYMLYTFINLLSFCGWFSSKVQIEHVLFRPQPTKRKSYTCTWYIDCHILVDSHQKVRKRAQAVLTSTHVNHAYSYRCLLDDLKQKLVESTTPEEQFKVSSQLEDKLHVRSVIWIWILLQVRKKAQEVLFQSSATLPYSYRCVLDNLKVRLVTSGIPEHAFKVSYVIVKVYTACMYCIYIAACCVVCKVLRKI